LGVFVGTAVGTGLAVFVGDADLSPLEHAAKINGAMIKM
jgi:hypothetical protein